MFSKMFKSRNKEIDANQESEDLESVPKIYFNELKCTSSVISLNKNTSPSKMHHDHSNIINPETQYKHFQESMRLLMFVGLFMGMNSIVGFNGKKTSDVRFKLYSIRFIIALVIMGAQITLGCIWFYQLMLKFSLFKFSFVAFYMFAGFINLSLIRVATKWPKLVTAINKSGLYGYIDPKCKTKCNTYVIVFMTSAILKYVLSQLQLLVTIFYCQPREGVFISYSYINFAWFFSLGLPKDFTGIVLMQIHIIISTLIETYCDVFVMCVSAYLSTIYTQINAKISATASQNHRPSTWRSLREHYNQASRLVRCFDDSINTLVFISYASNLFFICFQLFNLLGNGIFQKVESVQLSGLNCTRSDVPVSHSKWNGNAIYQLFSVLFLLVRFVCVTLTTANINSEATAPTVVLYSLSSESYSEEIDRFLEQLNNDTVALSGFRLFYVTRSLLLSVVATIITYELVLMQYNEHLHD